MRLTHRRRGGAHECARDSPLERRIRARMAALGANGLLRTLREPAGIDLSSNDYLDLSRHPSSSTRLIEGAGAKAAAARVAPAARRARASPRRAPVRPVQGHRAGAVFLERLPGQHRRADDAGRDRRRDVLGRAEPRQPDRRHAAVARPRGRVSAQRRPAAGTAACRVVRRAGVRFVVVESLFSMDGDVAPLADTRRSAGRRARCSSWTRRTPWASTADGAAGLIEAAGIDDDVCDFDQYGRQSARRRRRVRRRPGLGDRLPRPAGAAVRVFDGAAAGAGRRARRQPRRSWPRNPSGGSGCWSARRTCARVSRRPASTRCRPVGRRSSRSSIGDNDRAVAVARALQAEGFDVRAIRPPSVPPGTARLRVSVNAGLSEETLDRFVAALAAALREAGRLLRGVFVTGTDTGVGKTVVSRGALHRYRSLRSRSDTGRSRATGSRFRPASSRTMTPRKSSGWAAAARARFCGTASACRARVAAPGRPAERRRRSSSRRFSMALAAQPPAAAGSSRAPAACWFRSTSGVDDRT